MKCKFRLVPNATRRAYSVEVSYWEAGYEFYRTPKGVDKKDIGKYGYWRSIEINNEPIYFMSESNAKEYIEDYKKWLEKEPIEIE